MRRKDKSPNEQGLKITWSGCSDIDYEQAIKLLYGFAIDGVKPKNHNLEISHCRDYTKCYFTPKKGKVTYDND